MKNPENNSDTPFHVRRRQSPFSSRFCTAFIHSFIHDLADRRKGRKNVFPVFCIFSIKTRKECLGFKLIKKKTFFRVLKKLFMTKEEGGSNERGENWWKKVVKSISVPILSETRENSIKSVLWKYIFELKHAASMSLMHFDMFEEKEFNFWSSKSETNEMRREVWGRDMCMCSC